MTILCFEHSSSCACHWLSHTSVWDKVFDLWCAFLTSVTFHHLWLISVPNVSVTLIWVLKGNEQDPHHQLQTLFSKTFEYVFLEREYNSTYRWYSRWICNSKYCQILLACLQSVTAFLSLVMLLYNSFFAGMDASLNLSQPSLYSYGQIWRVLQAWIRLYNFKVLFKE